MVAKKQNSTKTPSASGSFSDVRGDSYTQNLKIKANIDLLMKGLMKYETKASVNTSEAIEDIQKKFTEFLIGCEFHMTMNDFAELLHESSQKPRDDGTAAWHHQFSQLMLFLDKVKRGVILLDQLEEYGGIEVAIRTIMRHDSLEDFNFHPTHFKKSQTEKIERTYDHLMAQGIIKEDDNWRKTEYQRLDTLMDNLMLMSKKIIALNNDGHPILNQDIGKFEKEQLFETDVDYIANMLEHETVSPLVFMYKAHDGCHNLGNMLMAPKFTPMKRKSYSNGREDMYGGRHAFPERAQRQWFDFEDPLKESDDLMGAILFINFGYLAMVDQDEAYPKNPKFKDGQKIHPSGVLKYIPGAPAQSGPKALAYSGPKAFSPLHNLLDDIQIISERTDADPVKAERARLFLEHAIKPVLRPHAHHFKTLFKTLRINKKPPQPSLHREMPS
jgi:hypothetical protein